jgi:hypothetical protein
VFKREEIAEEEEWDEVLSRLIGDCRAGRANGALRRFAVEEGAGLVCEATGVLALLLLLSFPLACLSGCPGVREGVLDIENGDKAYDMDVAMVVAVVALSPLLRLAFKLSDCFFFRTVAGGFKSMKVIAFPGTALFGRE